MPLEPGSRIAGKYRVTRVIGRGGMGVVLAAVHESLDAPVAIKVLGGDSALTEEQVARFLREARAASALRSEHVARVTDFGTLDDGQPFMALEYLEGEDYARVLERGPLRPEEAVDVVLQACAALAEAHAAGIVHRDLKPSNLFRTQRPDGSDCVKLLDFGVSKTTASREGAAITGTGKVLGTPLYMSPEQLRTPKDVDARADVWALGVVLYELLTGLTPFPADDLGVLFASILERDPVPLAEALPGVDPELAKTVNACLVKDRAARLGSVVELAARLEPFGSAEGRVAARRARGVGERASSVVALAQTMPVAAQDVTTAPTVQVATAPMADGAASRPMTLSGAASVRDGGRPSEARGSRGVLLRVLGACAVAAVVAIGWNVRQHTGAATIPTGPEAPPAASSALASDPVVAPASAAPVESAAASAAPEASAAATPPAVASASASPVASTAAKGRRPPTAPTGRTAPKPHASQDGPGAAHSLY